MCCNLLVNTTSYSIAKKTHIPMLTSANLRLIWRRGEVKLIVLEILSTITRKTIILWLIRDRRAHDLQNVSSPKNLSSRSLRKQTATNNTRTDVRMSLMQHMRYKMVGRSYRTWVMKYQIRTMLPTTPITKQSAWAIPNILSSASSGYNGISGNNV